jgi:uncharacterized protein (DUF302 family)
LSTGVSPGVLPAQAVNSFKESIMQYGFSRVVPHTYDAALDRVTQELQKEGFGVLTSIDVKETMKKKLGVDFPRYTILGACNPPLAHRALQVEEQIGLLLPCNVIVHEQEGRTVVAAFDPMMMALVLEKEEMRPIAEEVKRKLERVVAAV